MLAWPDHALFVLLALFGPVWGSTMGFRRLTRAADHELPRVRGSVYRGAIAVQWTVAIATLAWWAIARRPWAEIGLVPRFNLALAGIAVGFAIVVVVVLRQRGEVVADDESLAEVRRKLARLERMMPRTRAELRLFYGLSLTAGLCEELLYRGFLIWYFAHFVGLVQAAGLAAVVFGVGHTYQGPRGMLLTGLVGAFLGAVYLLTGSLLAPMVIHALMDMHSGSLGHVAFVKADAEAAEAEHQARAEAEAEAARLERAWAAPDAAPPGSPPDAPAIEDPNAPRV